MTYDKNDKPQFSRTPGGMSVRAIIKAKDVQRTPEYHVRSHSLGLLRALVELYPREAIEAVRMISLDRAK